MAQSLGRGIPPTTDGGDVGPPGEITAARRSVRDVPPPLGYEDTAFTDPHARRVTSDPLDQRWPSRENADPLDPDGHSI